MAGKKCGVKAGLLSCSLDHQGDRAIRQTLGCDISMSIDWSKDWTITDFGYIEPMA
jgi:hypothetical protein